MKGRTGSVSLLLVRTRPWVRQGFWAVLDQGLFSGANFVVNILLARWLPPEQYGAFVVAYSIFLLLATFHTAVLTEPMMVFGAGKYSDRFSEYLSIVFYAHWGVTSIVALLLAVGSLVMAKTGSINMARALGGLALASPFLLVLWLARRACYVHLRPQKAVVASAVNLVLSAAGVFLLSWAGSLSSFSSLLLLGTAALVASTLVIPVLKPRAGGFSDSPTYSMVFADHWGYGKWLVLHSVLYWLFSDAILPFISTFHDLHTAGVFRAYQNLTLPIFQFLTALSFVFLPAAAQSFHNGKFPGLRHIAFTYTVLCVLSTGLYGTVVYTFRRPIVSLVIGEGYLPYVELLGVWLWGPVVVAFGRGAEIALRASAKPRFILYSYVLGSSTALVSFALLIPSFGLWGAISARILSFAVQTTSVIVISAAVFGLGTDKLRPTCFFMAQGAAQQRVHRNEGHSVDYQEMQTSICRIVRD